MLAGAMDSVEIHDPRFRWLVPGNCMLEKLFGGMRWAEGPVWFADGDYLVVMMAKDGMELLDEQLAVPGEHH